jgi:hypothetical protein
VNNVLVAGHTFLAEIFVSLVLDQHQALDVFREISAIGVAK